MNEAPVDGNTNSKELPELLYSGVEILKVHTWTADINRNSKPMPSDFAGRLRQLNRVQSASVPAVDYYWRTQVIPELLKQRDEFALHPHHTAMFAAYF